jgi:hypothetical protein
MEYANLVQQIRGCESEAAAELVLVRWINQFKYSVGLDIGEKHDQANVVVGCKHFDNGPMHVVFAEDLTASKGKLQVAPTEWSGLTEPEVDACYESIMFDQDIEPSRMGVYLEIEAKLKEKNT